MNLFSTISNKDVIIHSRGKVLNKESYYILMVIGSFCLQRRISLTTEPISWFNFTVKLLIGSGKVYNYSGGGYLKSQEKNIFGYIKIIFLNSPDHLQKLRAKQPLTINNKKNLNIASHFYKNVRVSSTTLIDNEKIG